MPELQILRSVLLLVRARLATLRDDERGVGTLEVVLLGAAMATAAIVVGAILVARVTDQAKSIPTGSLPTP